MSEIKPWDFVYQFMKYCDVPDVMFEDYVVSCNYGTINPSSFGLWGLYDRTWYRIDEYYYDAQKEGLQRTDEEHYDELEKLCVGKNVSRVVVNLSASNFICEIQRHGKFDIEVVASVTEKPIYQRLMYEIGNTAYALLSKRIKICNSCEESMREFSLYHYCLNKEGRKIPVEKNNRAMDEIRYFVHTILNGRWLERTTNQVGEGGVVRKWTDYICSECNMPTFRPENFCPHCGKKMESNGYVDHLDDEYHSLTYCAPPWAYWNK